MKKYQEAAADSLEAVREQTWRRVMREYRQLKATNWLGALKTREKDRAIAAKFNEKLKVALEKEWGRLMRDDNIAAWIPLIGRIPPDAQETVYKDIALMKVLKKKIAQLPIFTFHYQRREKDLTKKFATDMSRGLERAGRPDGSAAEIFRVADIKLRPPYAYLFNIGLGTLERKGAEIIAPAVLDDKVLHFSDWDAYETGIAVSHGFRLSPDGEFFEIATACFGADDRYAEKITGQKQRGYRKAFDGCAGTALTIAKYARMTGQSPERLDRAILDAMGMESLGDLPEEVADGVKMARDVLATLDIAYARGTEAARKKYADRLPLVRAYNEKFLPDEMKKVKRE